MVARGGGGVETWRHGDGVEAMWRDRGQCSTEMRGVTVLSPPLASSSSLVPSLRGSWPLFALSKWSRVPIEISRNCPPRLFLPFSLYNTADRVSE